MTARPKVLSRKQKVLLGVGIGGVILGFGLLIYLTIKYNLYEILSNRQAIQHTLEQAGSWGPLLFILIQTLQIIIAPIPGQVATLIGGYLFGGVWGSLYSMVGSLLGFSIVFFLARKFGRPLVERYFEKDLLEKFDYLTKAAGPTVFFMIFLLPGFPDDLACYLAGLTKIRITTLIVISLLGRLPSTIMTGYIGSGVASSNIQSVAWMTAFFIVVVAVSYWQRDKLEAWAKRLAKK